MSDVFRDETFGCCCKCILGVNTAHYKTLMQWYMVHLRATECAGVESHMSRGAVKCDVTFVLLGDVCHDKMFACYRECI